MFLAGVPPDPPTVDFAFRANNGCEVSLFALGNLIDHVAAIVESFADLLGPATTATASEPTSQG